ncbi:MAG: hypothetical protein ACK40M_06325 [Flavobacteriales bacterium]
MEENVVLVQNKNVEQQNETEISTEKNSIKQETESGYKKIRPKILSMLEDSSFHVEYHSHYFTTTDIGEIRPENFEAFGYVCKRIFCILENVLCLCHKRKVFYNTILTIRKGLAETLTSAYYKQLPSGFPFNTSLVHLFEQLGEFESVLFKSKEGMKFSLEKKKAVLYINMLRMLRGFVCEKQPFRELFPHYFKG